MTYTTSGTVLQTYDFSGEIYFKRIALAPDDDFSGYGLAKPFDVPRIGSRLRGTVNVKCCDKPAIRLTPGVSKSPTNWRTSWRSSSSRKVATDG
jgi:hypothetical protein